ncbi:MAG: nucleotide exchange factor GrpE [Actinobacteria bacterium]|nr:nucleotide exchange factor GrpE [Actinomycetota bacterium]
MDRGIKRPENGKNNKDSGNGRDNEVLSTFEKMKKDPHEETKLKKTVSKKKITEELEIEELVSEIDVLRKELEECKNIEDDYIDRIKRLQADYDNYRKRTIKEHLEHIKRANKDLISKLIPVIDNFEMALDAGQKIKKDDDFYRGIKMIHDKLIEMLQKENVTVIEPIGEEFDPKICEAAVTEAVEDEEEGKVLEVLRKGYMIDDFVIRPAVVKVCKKN